jgi:CheY-like chemotaxis protein
VTAEPSGPPGSVSTGRRHVLVVDDDRSSRDGLRVALSRIGHLVEAAADAWQAIARLRRQRFDVAVVDLDLPPVHGMDLGGWDVARIARAYQPGIVLVLLSAESAEDDPALALEAHALGRTHILAKPIGLGQLTALVESGSLSGGRAATRSSWGAR